MIGMCDVTMCTYIVNISELTFHRLAPFLLKIISGCLYLDARFLRMVYAIVILTSPLCTVNSAHNVVPISRYLKFAQSGQFSQA